MVFSPIPLYLDPPNWHQVQGSGGNDQNQHHLVLPPSGMGGGASRASSMSERAKLAKIPAPEAPLKCPRCDSSNTKFCYFNNYSLTQPRHFCKNCRRYWTRGGALRTVPVGGGCRRNKRSSSSTSATKSSSGTGVATSSPSLSSAGFVFPPSGGGSMTSFMASLQNIAHLGMGNLGLTSFGGALHGVGGLGLPHRQSEVDHNFNNHGLFNHNEIEHSPSGFLNGFELPASGGNSADKSLFSEVNTSENNINPSSIIIDSQAAPVKMEDHHSNLNLAKQLMGISSTNDHNNSNQFWGANIGNVTNMWTDLSGLNSSSTTHHLL